MQRLEDEGEDCIPDSDGDFDVEDDDPGTDDYFPEYVPTTDDKDEVIVTKQARIDKAKRPTIAEAQAAGRSLFPAGFMTYTDKFADDLNEVDYGSDPDNNDNEDGDHDGPIGPKTRQLEAEGRMMREILETSGWLGLRLPRAEWASIIKNECADLTANKLSNLPPETEEDRKKKKKFREGLSILLFHYFIVTNHATASSIMPLRIYMGGIGGQALAMQAAKARNIHDDSFGSLSMVVAGDFAQLPPM
ncbi:hypothetical protein B0H17DRAFT_1269486 [Mycena rosella]|uniref:ATP-dependent DNA helicase n=1 Tax=Mycena rosella TaxID=1033263 RepID=A0AAD7DNZ3_MYCRO|nr:hypothetical protein B0H17DRAFT_1269486 [Mycena rosella]